MYEFRNQFQLLEPADAHYGMAIWVCIREENGEKIKLKCKRD